MAERGGLVQRWSIRVGLSLALVGLNAGDGFAQGRDIRVKTQVTDDHGVLQIHDAGAGSSVIDPAGPMVVVRLARPLSGSPVVAVAELKRWLEDITVDDHAMAIRLRSDVEIRRRKSTGDTIELELRDDQAGVRANRTTVRRIGAGDGTKIRRPPLLIEPAAGPDPRPVVASAAVPMPVVRIDGPAAVFEREGVVWIASTSSRAPSAPTPLRGVQALAPAVGPGGSALRLRLSGLVPVVSRSDGEIRVEFRAGDAPTPVPAHHVNDAGATAIRLHDPDVGDELEVELAQVPHAASPVAWYASGVEVLPSWLGRATRRTTEVASSAIGHSAPAKAVSHPSVPRPSARPVHVGPDEIDLADGTTSSPSVAVDNQAHSADPESPPRVVDREHALSDAFLLHERATEDDHVAEGEDRSLAAAELRLVDLADLGEAGRAAARRQALAAVAADRAALAPRLELAQLMLADAMATEAAAVLEAARRHRQAPVDAPDLEAAIAALNGRTDEASRLLKHAGEAAERALWRTFIAASRGAPNACLPEWERSRQVLWRYPEPLLRRMAVPIARCILDTGRIDVTLALLERLEPSLRAAPARDQATALHLRAKALGRDGRWPEAQRALAKVIERGDPLVRVRAVFDEVVMAREAGQMPAGTAYEELALQAATWRGHPDEALMLDRLARMAEEAGRPGEALATWRRALDRTPDHPALRGTAEAMREALRRALLDVERHDVEGGPHDGAGDRAGAVSRLALALSWRQLPWTEEIHALALRVADLAADQGVPRAALSLAGETAAPPLQVRWQLLAGDTVGALATIRSDPQALSAAEAAVAAGRLNDALALLPSPNHDAPSRNEISENVAGWPSGGEDAAEARRPRSGTLVQATTSQVDEAPKAATGIGHAMPRDIELVNAVTGLAAIEGPTEALEPKLAEALTALRGALEDGAQR